MKLNERKKEILKPSWDVLFDKIQPQPSWGATLTQEDRKKKAKTETAVGLNEAEKWTFVLNEVSLCLRLLAPSVIFAPLSFAATTNGNTPVHVSVCCLLEAFCNWSAALHPLILIEMWVFSTFNLVKFLAKVDHHPNKAILDVLDTPEMLCIKRPLWLQESRYKVGNCFLWFLLHFLFWPWKCHFWINHFCLCHNWGVILDKKTPTKGYLPVYPQK